MCRLFKFWSRFWKTHGNFQKIHLKSQNRDAIFEFRPRFSKFQRRFICKKSSQFSIFNHPSQFDQKSISIFKNVIQFSSFNLYFQNFSDDLEKWMSTISISILKNRCRFSKIHPFSLSSNWMDSSSTRMGVFGECRFSMLHIDFQKFITIFDFQKSI